MKTDLPQLERTPEGFKTRLRYGNGKQAKFLIRLTEEGQAMARASKLRDLSTVVRRLSPEEARIILTRAAGARSDATFEAIARAAQEDAGTPSRKARAPVTFAELADEWTSGALHRRFPDHVAKKRTADLDGQRFALVNQTIGGLPIVEFRLEDADRAMSALPEGLSPATRRQYGQLISRVLKLAVYPCRLRKESPIPPGWLPSALSKRAKSWLYPDEEAQLVASRDVPMERRLLYAFLAREGMRVSEALGLRWSDVDLVRGTVRLDANKTDAPRSWALDAGVVRALRNVRPVDAKPGEHVFLPPPGDKNAEVLREDLKRAQVTRSELFEGSAQRMKIRAHDLRGTFVTLAIANGKTEGWVQDRTGHQSSQMINRYRQAARMAHEVGVGTLVPMHLAFPEFWGPHLPGENAQGESGVSLESWKQIDPSDSQTTKPQRLPGFMLAPEAGLEPATSGLTVRCSAN